MISSAKHSAIPLMLLNDDFLAPAVIKNKAKLIHLIGETSTDDFLAVPPDPVLALLSLGPAFETAFNKASIGFLPVTKAMISKVYLTIVIAIFFLPVFLPCLIKVLVSLSTIGQVAFLNLLT